MINAIFRGGEGVGGSRKTNISAAWKVCRSKGRWRDLARKMGMVSILPQCTLYLHMLNVSLYRYSPIYWD